MEERGARAVIAPGRGPADPGSSRVAAGGAAPAGQQLLFSLKPRFAEAILRGDKTVELRKVVPRLRFPADAWLYASRPVSALVGTCRFVQVTSDSPAALWPEVESSCGVTSEEYGAYFEGRAVANGISIASPRRLSPPVTLLDLRAAGIPRPPQNFCYVRVGAIEAAIAGRDQRLRVDARSK